MNILPQITSILTRSIPYAPYMILGGFFVNYLVQWCTQSTYRRTKPLSDPKVLKDLQDRTPQQVVSFSPLTKKCDKELIAQYKAFLGSKSSNLDENYLSFTPICSIQTEAGVNINTTNLGPEAVKRLDEMQALVLSIEKSLFCNQRGTHLFPIVGKKISIQIKGTNEQVHLLSPNDSVAQVFTDIEEFSDKAWKQSVEFMNQAIQDFGQMKSSPKPEKSMQSAVRAGRMRAGQARGKQSRPPTKGKQPISKEKIQQFKGSLKEITDCWLVCKNQSLFAAATPFQAYFLYEVLAKQLSELAEVRSRQLTKINDPMTGKAYISVIKNTEQNLFELIQILKHIHPVAEKACETLGVKLPFINISHLEDGASITKGFRDFNRKIKALE